MEAMFGNIGVCVEDFTKESLYEFLESHHLGELLNSHYFEDSSKFTSNMYLQSESLGPYREGNALYLNGGYIHFVTCMENYLHILHVGILDPDAANDLVDELYSQGLIKPRNYHV